MWQVAALCQYFSFLGRRQGVHGPQFHLFLYFLQLWYAVFTAFNEILPIVFLFENVVMDLDQAKYISSCLGCSPLLVNAADLGWHTRCRLIWCDIPIGYQFYNFISSYHSFNSLSIPPPARFITPLSSIFCGSSFPTFISESASADYPEGRFPTISR